MKKRLYLKDTEAREEGNTFSVIADFEGNEEQLMDIEVNEILPILPLRNMVLFPGVFMPVSVGRKTSMKLVREAEKKGAYIGVVCQKVAETEMPSLEDLHTIGTVGKIIRILEMPDQTTTIILQGVKRMELEEIVDTIPYLKGRVKALGEDIPDKNDKEFHALVEACKDLTIRYIKSSDMFPQDSAFAIKNITNPMFLVNFICTNLPLKKDEKIELLRIDTLRARTYRLLEILNREVQLAEIKESIQMRAREDIDQQQREYFLQQQIKTIQDELGGGGQEQEIEELRRKAIATKWSTEVRDTFMKEVDKLERTHPQSPDYSVQLNYLQTMLSLPWGIYTTDNLNLVNAEKTLNKDHYGLEKVKERILEHLAVKLPVSRLQRDLTDSTVLRNVGVPFGHIVIAIQSSLKGLRKLLLNEPAIYRDLDNCWSVVAEAIQTILRREAYPHPYEALKALTRTNQAITESSIKEFIEELNVSEDIKKELRVITPHNYTGI